MYSIHPFYYSIFEVLVSITFLIDMSFFITSTNVIFFNLPLPFFHSLNLDQPTYFYRFINHSTLNMTKSSQVILPHLFHQ